MSFIPFTTTVTACVESTANNLAGSLKTPGVGISLKVMPKCWNDNRDSLFLVYSGCISSCGLLACGSSLFLGARMVSLSLTIYWLRLIF